MHSSLGVWLEVSPSRGKGREKTLWGYECDKTRGAIEWLWRIGLWPKWLVYISIVTINLSTSGSACHIL